MAARKEQLENSKLNKAQLQQEKLAKKSTRSSRKQNLAKLARDLEEQPTAKLPENEEPQKDKEGQLEVYEQDQLMGLPPQLDKRYKEHLEAQAGELAPHNSNKQVELQQAAAGTQARVPVEEKQKNQHQKRSSQEAPLSTPRPGKTSKTNKKQQQQKVQEEKPQASMPEGEQQQQHQEPVNKEQQTGAQEQEETVADKQVPAQADEKEPQPKPEETTKTEAKAKAKAKAKGARGKPDAQSQELAGSSAPAQPPSKGRKRKGPAPTAGETDQSAEAQADKADGGQADGKVPGKRVRAPRAPIVAIDVNEHRVTTQEEAKAHLLDIMKSCAAKGGPHQDVGAQFPTNAPCRLSIYWKSSSVGLKIRVVEEEGAPWKWTQPYYLSMAAGCMCAKIYCAKQVVPRLIPLYLNMVVFHFPG